MHTIDIVTVQDISCVGQCSLTVALPILSACGLETAILPSAVLSTHTAGFTGFTCRDLTSDMPAIINHWEKEDIHFNSIYTGYLGSKEQIDYVLDLRKRLLLEGGKFIVDPAMADNGKLYPAFDMNFVSEMKKLVSEADLILPNITEACFLTGIPYKETYDEAYIEMLVNALLNLGAKSVVLTGISYKKDETGVFTEKDGEKSYYRHYKYETGCHGTGDVYSSAFVGAYMKGKSMEEAAKIAADYTLSCITSTKKDPNHFYGVKFEPLLKDLQEMISGERGVSE